MATQYGLTQLVWAQPAVSGTVTATITAPDTTVSTVAASSGSQQNPGFFTAWFTPQQTGQYTIGWASTGGQTGTATVTVTAPSTASLLTIQDCYATLKIPAASIGTDPVRDADMLAYAAAAQTVVEGIVGPVVPTTITEVLDGGTGTLLLRAKPTSILSVTVNGQPFNGWVPDFTAAMLLAYGSGFPAGSKNVNVAYTAGNGLVHPNVRAAIRAVFQQTWERSRALAGAGQSPEMVMQGFAVPNAVYELLAAESILPGIA